MTVMQVYPKIETTVTNRDLLNNFSLVPVRQFCLIRFFSSHQQGARQNSLLSSILLNQKIGKLAK